MVPEWLCILLLIGAYVIGYMDACGRCCETDDPFWRGYMDIRTLRVLWRRLRS